MALQLPTSILVTRRLRVTDMHTGGHAARILDARSVVQIPEGLTIVEKIRFFKEKHDDIRKSLMWEPRGHEGMFGVFIVSSNLEGAHFGTIFVHHSGYGPMCGHATVAMGRYAIDYGIVPPTGVDTEVRIECPCGLVTCYVDTSGERTGEVSMESVPSFVVKRDLPVAIDRFGPASVLVDICFGGAFFVIVEAQKILGKTLSEATTRELLDAVTPLTEYLRQTLTLEHPSGPELAFLEACIVTEGAKHTTIYGENYQVDRGPCGSGVTSRMALEYAKGNVKIGETRSFSSCKTGGVLKGTVIRKEGSNVVVKVKGKAHYVGTAEFVLEEDDKIGFGFLLD